MKFLKTNWFTQLNAAPRQFRQRRNYLTGLTLIEVLVYIAVLSVLIGALTSFFVWTVRSNSKAKIAREVLDTGRRILRIISSETKGAGSIYTPTSVFDSHPGQLSLETARNLPEGENKTYLDFYICEEHLCLKRESQSPIVLTSDKVKISNLVFTRIGDVLPSIKIELKIESADTTGRMENQAEVELSSVISLRL